jgi:hypothetical protein
MEGGRAREEGGREGREQLGSHDLFVVVVCLSMRC